MDSDYEHFVQEEEKKEPKEKKKHVLQEWKKITIIEETYLERHLDILLREKKWLFKILYTQSTFSVLKCEEGIDCPYKQRIKHTETSMEFPEHHALSNICRNVFDGKVQILTIEENSQGHRGHKSGQELEELFKKRTQGCSYFGKMLVRKLELHLQKHANRVETLKIFFQDDFKWHFPNNKALATFCYNYRKEQFFKTLTTQ